MRVRATATGSSQSNAIGQLELSCTPGGLSLGFYGIGAYAEGYATGALTMGTRFVVPYCGIVAARVVDDALHLQLEAPGLPHNRLVLSGFTPGPGVPPLELRRRRLILHFAALSVGALACLAATILAPSYGSEGLAWGALGYGALAASMILALGFSFDRGLLQRGPDQAETREAFLSELALHYPNIQRGGSVPAPKKQPTIPNWGAFLPRTAATIGLTLAATVLTGLVFGQRLFMNGARDTLVASQVPTTPTVTDTDPSTPTIARPSALTAPPTTLPSDGLSPPKDPIDRPAEGSQDGLTIERRCLCDRAHSQLWDQPIPRLSGLLIERRAIQLKNYVRTEAQVGVVNNGDTPVNELTLHVQFYERRGEKRVPTKERPLYFEGPLNPGEAIKWKAEARGTEFEIIVPDLGALGPNGDGAANATAFRELLRANHRPVRLHAARMLAYLGDDLARKAALDLKDAMRAAEAPYLRRILGATGNTVVCDLEVNKSESASASVCIYNAADSELTNVGVQLNYLEGRMNVDQPLENPPSVLAWQKWVVAEQLGPQTGMMVTVPLPPSFELLPKTSVEAIADRYDLLD